MKNAATVNEQSRSANHFRNIFDRSLDILCDGAGAVRMHRRTLPLHIDDANLQKRALSDAAKALAALWKISDNKSPKLQNGAIQYSR